MSRVLVGCERSGRVRDAFIRLGHDAWSCDTEPSDAPGPHIRGDVRDVLGTGWDLGIFHPPCTYLCNSGVRWLFDADGTRNELRWQQMREGAALFLDCLWAPIPRIAVENPIMHKHAVALIGRRQDQTVQPWMFGEGETKATGLWLRNLPRLEPTDVVEGRVARIHRMAPSADRGRQRSVTYQGFANAMAAQWGALLDAQAVA